MTTCMTDLSMSPSKCVLILLQEHIGADIMEPELNVNGNLPQEAFQAPPGPASSS